MTAPGLKSIGKAASEVVIPPGELEALRSIVAIEAEAMAELGRAYLEEARAAKIHDRALEALKVTRGSAIHAQQHRKQVQTTILKTLEVDDGSWDLDLEAGKLLRTDGKS